MQPVDELRNQLRLVPATGHPLFEGKFSPLGSLAWYSHLLAPPRRDWPTHTRITGFPFYDRQEARSDLDSRLAEFLVNGDPPVVFTLGTTTVLGAGDFFDQSALAVRRLGCRAVLLVGAQSPSGVRTSLSDSIFVGDYASYATLFPRAAVTVHQGGIGTIGQALRAGRPSLIVPFHYDQPDNAQRVAKLGVARVLDRKLYTAERAGAELRRLLSDTVYSARAAEIGQAIRNEDGIAGACDGLEEFAAGA